MSDPRVTQALEALRERMPTHRDLPALLSLAEPLARAGRDRVYGALHARLLNEPDGVRSAMIGMPWSARRQAMADAHSRAALELEQRKLDAARVSAVLERMGDVLGRAALIALMGAL